MFESLLDLNDQLLLAINGAHNEFFDSVMMVATNRWTWIPLYAGSLVYLIWRFGWQRALLMLAMIVAAIALADQIGDNLIRDNLKIMRPSNINNPLSEHLHLVNGYRAGRYGFPSCHAANCSAFALMMCLLCRRRWIWILLSCWVALNCYSRMYLGVHYPSDILAGLLLGTAVAALIYMVTDRLLKRLNFPPLPHAERTPNSYISNIPTSPTDKSAQEK